MFNREKVLLIHFVLYKETDKLNEAADIFTGDIWRDGKIVPE